MMLTPTLEAIMLLVSYDEPIKAASVFLSNTASDTQLTRVGVVFYWTGRKMAGPLNSVIHSEKKYKYVHAECGSIGGLERGKGGGGDLQGAAIFLLMQSGITGGINSAADSFVSK